MEEKKAEDDGGSCSLPVLPDQGVREGPGQGVREGPERGARDSSGLEPAPTLDKSISSIQVLLLAQWTYKGNCLTKDDIYRLNRLLLDVGQNVLLVNIMEERCQDPVL